MAREASRKRRADDMKAQLVARPYSVPAHLVALEDQQTPAGCRQTPRASSASSDSDRGNAANDQLAADSDQAASDIDRAASDSDQLASDIDRAASDSDQLASDIDQAASDRDLASGGDAEAHALSRDVRQRSALHRQHIAQARLDAGAARDRVAEVRDQAALARDRAAEARDQAIAERDIADQHAAQVRAVSGAEIVMRAAPERRRAAKRRAQGAEQLALAAFDREAAAGDRAHAAAQRRHALADRDALAHHVAIIQTDALTGARTRQAGLIDLDHERERCHRSGAGLLLAYVHTNTACGVSDVRGHNAGDELLRRVVASIHDHLRSYDLIIRFTATDFVCAMSNMTVPTARQRFDTIATATSQAITTGFAALTSRQSIIELITHAHSTAH
jgi:diguanylate cyclase (GGDEF)-like protein